MGDLRMNKENREQVQKRGHPNPQQVGILMGVVAVVVPYGFSYHPDINFPEIYVYAVVWGLLVRTTAWYLELPPYLDILQLQAGSLFLWIITFMYLLGIRILFAYQTVRYFHEKTTRKRLITVGVLAEFPMVVFLLGDILRYIILIINRTITSFPSYPIIPIPCMLILGMLLLRYFPTPSESDWDLERETEKMWVETGSDSTKAQEDKLPPTYSYPTTVKLNGGDEFA
jgi:hypothetical protein